MPKLPAIFNLKDTNWRKILPTFLVRAFFLITLLTILISLHTREIMHNNLHLVLHEEQGQMHFTESLLHQELACEISGLG